MHPLVLLVRATTWSYYNNFFFLLFFFFGFNNQTNYVDDSKFVKPKNMNGIESTSRWFQNNYLHVSRNTHTKQIGINMSTHCYKSFKSK